MQSGLLLEHTFRFFKQVLGWTAPKLRDPAAADRWTWLLIAAYTQLRLAAPLAADLRLPWQRPAPPGRMTPARGRRGFRAVRDPVPSPAAPPSPRTPSPGRPPASAPPAHHPAVTPKLAPRPARHPAATTPEPATPELVRPEPVRANRARRPGGRHPAPRRAVARRNSRTRSGRA